MPFGTGIGQALDRETSGGAAVSSCGKQRKAVEKAAMVNR